MNSSTWGQSYVNMGAWKEEIRKRTVKGRQVMGALERVMKGRNVSMAVKKGIRNSVILNYHQFCFSPPSLQVMMCVFT